MRTDLRCVVCDAPIRDEHGRLVSAEVIVRCDVCGGALCGGGNCCFEERGLVFCAEHGDYGDDTDYGDVVGFTDKVLFSLDLMKDDEGEIPRVPPLLRHAR